MEKKRKNNKLPPTSLEDETSEFLSKEDQSQTCEGHTRKNLKTGTLPPENAPPFSQQNAPILQWPYTSLPTLDQSPQIPRPSVPTQATPVVLSRTPLLNPQQPQQQQQNLINLQLQHGRQASQATESNGAFWLPPGPGFHVAGAACEPFTPIGTTDAKWQPLFLPGAAASGNEPHLPGFCFQGGYSPPMGFPGPWDPSSWWRQAQQPQPPYSFPGVYGYYSVPPPPASNCSTAFGQLHQRGIIRPPAKLSQKHQQMWGAQSVENVQLWSVIGQLQSEIAAYGSRLMKLEAEVLSLKPAVEEPPGTGSGNAEPGRTSKRGRPKRPVASIDAFNSPDGSQPRGRGRKRALCKVQSETEGQLNSEKENLNKFEDEGKACHQAGIDRMATYQENNDGKMTIYFRNGSSSHNFELDGGDPKLPLEGQATSTFLNDVHQDIPGIQIAEVGVNPSSGKKDNDNKEDDQKSAFSVLSPHVKGNDIEAASSTYRATSNVGQGWTSNILSEYSGRNMLEMGSHSFYDSSSVIRQGGKVVPGWSFVNEEEASEELVAGSGDDDEEMDEDANSRAEEICQAKGGGAYNLDPT